MVNDAEDLTTTEAESVAHTAHEARLAYGLVRGLYSDFASSLALVIENCVEDAGISVHSITHRAKGLDSFERKAGELSPDNPLSAKYPDPMTDITDKAGVRIITYFLSTVSRLSALIPAQLDVLETETRISAEPDRLGYQSTHYLVRYSTERTILPEYRRFVGLVAEIQVRTILQHAWAEIEHDIQYKAVATLPSRVRRRFAALAGLIEIADREFQAIEDKDRVLREEARRNVDLGQLEKVEITRDSLRTYLDRKYGSDGRMSDYSYDWTARILLKSGFANLAEVDECINAADDDAISRAVYGTRQGQLTRFELVLLARMGENFILAHPWGDRAGGSPEDWFVRAELSRLERLRAAGIVIGDFRPSGYPETNLRASDLAALVDRGLEPKESGPIPAE